jgi:hypothetical protein
MKVSKNDARHLWGESLEMSKEDKMEGSVKITACKVPKIGRLAPFYLNGDLSQNEMRKVKIHLYECAECREGLRFLKTAQKLIQTGRHVFCGIIREPMSRSPFTH